MLVNIVCCRCRALTKLDPVAPAIYAVCLEWVGYGVLVWCAPSRRGGSGVPTPGKSLVCLTWRGGSGVPFIGRSAILEL